MSLLYKLKKYPLTYKYILYLMCSRCIHVLIFWRNDVCAYLCHVYILYPCPCLLVSYITWTLITYNSSFGCWEEKRKERGEISLNGEKEKKRKGFLSDTSKQHWEITLSLPFRRPLSYLATSELSFDDRSSFSSTRQRQRCTHGDDLTRGWASRLPEVDVFFPSSCNLTKSWREMKWGVWRESGHSPSPFLSPLCCHPNKRKKPISVDSPSFLSKTLHPKEV